jgi:prolipoprotein diacylglyceryltransferase
LIAIVLISFGKSLKAGQVFAAYVFSYCVGRFFIELIRIDAANTVGGLRVNVWVSAVVALVAVTFFARASKKQG